MNYTELKEYISSGQLDETIRQVICNDDVSEEKKRYLSLLEDAYKLYGDGDYHFVSSPGRSEIGGNHTDHNHGKVLAASASLDTLACVSKRKDSFVRVRSEGYPRKS